MTWLYVRGSKFQPMHHLQRSPCAQFGLVVALKLSARRVHYIFLFPTPRLPSLLFSALFPHIESFSSYNTALFQCIAFYTEHCIWTLIAVRFWLFPLLVSTLYRRWHPSNFIRLYEFLCADDRRWFKQELQSELLSKIMQIAIWYDTTCCYHLSVRACFTFVGFLTRGTWLLFCLVARFLQLCYDLSRSFTMWEGHSNRPINTTTCWQ